MRRFVLLLCLCLCASMTLAACGHTPDAELAPEAETAAPLVHWTVASSHPFVLADARTEQMISLDIEAISPDSLDRRALNVSLVVDHSGSMSGEQMADARQAVLDMLATLDDDDFVSVIAFSSQVDALLPHQRWGDADQEAVFEAVSALQPVGTTAMSDALSTALSSVQSFHSSERVNRIMLLSDGEANSPERLPQLAANAGSWGIAVTTMGLGPYFNEQNLAMIADTSGGHYRFIEKSEEIAAFFLDEVRSMEQIVAQSASIQLMLGPNVEIVDAVGATVQPNGARGAYVNLGTMSAGERRQVALRLAVGAGGDGAHVEILDAKLTWVQPIDPSGQGHTGQSMTTSTYLGAQATGDAPKVEASRDLAVLEVYGRLQAAAEVAQALEFVRSGRLQEGRQMLLSAASQYKQNNVVSPTDVQLDVMANEAAEALLELEAAPGLPHASPGRPAPRVDRVELKRAYQGARSLSGL